MGLVVHDAERDQAPDLHGRPSDLARQRQTALQVALCVVETPGPALRDADVEQRQRSELGVGRAVVRTVEG
jgi:hypothetical protein